MMQESYWGHATAFWHKLLTWQGIVKIHTCADWEANVKFCGCVSVLLGKTSERPTVPCVPLSFSKNQSLCWRDMDPLLFGKTHRIQLLSSCQFVWVHLTVALLLICITLQLSWREQHCVNALIRVVKHSPEIITNHVPGARNHGSCLHVSGETVVGGGEDRERERETDNATIVELHLSEHRLSVSPIIWIGLAVRVNLSRILRN